MKTNPDLTKQKDILKAISKHQYYSVEQFKKDVVTYIKAIKERRMMCSIHSVSSTGMSRVISFHSCEKSKGGYYYRNYMQFFMTLGYQRTKDHFRIHGCGMDMIFHTNYSNMHTFHRLGFLTKKECEHLAQQTPTVL